MDSLPPSDSGSEPPPPSDSGEEPPIASSPRPSPKKPQLKVKSIKQGPAGSKFQHHLGDSMKEYLPQDIVAYEVRHFFMEVYSPPRIAPELPQGKTTTSIDIHAGWDLSKECSDPAINWEAVVAYQKKVRPKYLMTCPPCTAFSTLRRHVSVREAAAQKGMWHLNLTMNMIKNQMANNDFYVFEHPDRAVSWETQVVQDTCCEASVATQ